ncbi:recombinase RecA [Candidatus Mycoplasma haematobovis]|uniref:Protein RecA n=1 Tax=Candidatus Mycoplasma haematobovis TaxID=432608 RepID=A0A1A9QCJ7_9MOLU|nr:recombinase RecA [Candidatus Mycoplasma haematobovis]OAL10302.1 recombinase RecA [Candidatus Mycoplasma haematobovis]
MKNGKKPNTESKDSFLSLEELGVKLWSKNFNDNSGIEVISTGSYFLNKVLGVGGWPVGKIIEIFGSDSSGKSTLALHAVAEAQKINKCVVYIDIENTLNPNWAKKIGVDLNNIFVASPVCGENTFELIAKLIDTNNVDLIIVDSVAALVPYFEFENNIQDQTMGLHARLMSKGLRIIQSKMINSKTTIIFINQIRDKIGNSYIPTTTTTGGRALKYSACIRVEIKRCESIKDANNTVIGFITKATVIKNKYGAPLSVANTALYFESGFDYVYEIIQEAINLNILNKKGSWFEFKEKNIAQGIVQLRKHLQDNPALFEKIKEEIFKVK